MVAELNADGRERGRQLVEKIYAEYARKQHARHSRRIGHSWIGGECMRALFYKFRWCYEPERFEGRMLRLFETGQLEEPRMVSDLRSVGAVIHDTDHNDPTKQIGIESLDGHMAGFLDAAGHSVPFAFDEDEWIVVEMKTHSAKSFAQLKSRGVEIAKPEHMAQMRGYMHETGIKQALYLAKDKNTDELYAEFVRADEQHAKRLAARAKELKELNEPPGKLSHDPSFFKCKFCPASNVCHHGAPIARNCRTCAHAAPADGGLWSCKHHGSKLSVAEQERGCSHHVYLPGLVPGEPVDANPSENWIEYKLENGEKWKDDHERTSFRPAEQPSV